MPLLLLAGAALPPVAAGAQNAAPPAASGSFFHARLMPPKAQPACPPDIGPMYRATEIVTGTDMRQRPWGFAKAMREVLVKASGDPRLEGDPRIAPYAADAARFVACFRYVDMMAGIPLHDDQGTYDRPYRLAVSFAPAGIDALLARLGDKPWRGERPVVVPLLLVDGPRPPPYLLSGEIPAGVEEREAFAVAAEQFGLRVRFPSEVELRSWGADAGRLPTELPSSSRGAAIVVGTLDWREALPGWVGRWRMRRRAAVSAWGIGGVNYDAAFRNIARGVLLVASGAGPPDAGD